MASINSKAKKQLCIFFEVISWLLSILDNVIISKKN